MAKPQTAKGFPKAKGATTTGAVAAKEMAAMEKSAKKPRK